MKKGRQHPKWIRPPHQYCTQSHGAALPHTLPQLSHRWKTGVDTLCKTSLPFGGLVTQKRGQKNEQDQRDSLVITTIHFWEAANPGQRVGGCGRYGNGQPQEVTCRYKSQRDIILSDLLTVQKDTEEANTKGS